MTHVASAQRAESGLSAHSKVAEKWGAQFFSKRGARSFEGTKYCLSTLPEDIAFDRLVDVTRVRRRIERDYPELKQELKLGHYEGRGWRGFHHHATLRIGATDS